MMYRQSVDFVIHMTLYGILFGCLVGFFSGMPLILILFDKPIHPDYMGSALIGGVIGGLVGLVYGSFAGLISGVTALFVTRIFFRDIHRPQAYRTAMSVVTVLATAVFLIIVPIWIIFEDAGFAVYLMALLFAIHASQRVASEYLRESDGRKRKGKVA